MFCRMNKYGLNRRWLFVLLGGLLTPVGVRGTVDNSMLYNSEEEIFTDSLVAVSAVQATAEQGVVADTVNAEELMLDSSANQRINFNPLDYQLQKRYLYKGEEFKKRPFYERAYIGLYGGLQQVAPKGGRRLETGMSAAGFLGYDFNRLSSIRLSGDLNMYKLISGKGTIKQIGLDLDYLFNVSSYLYGYNPRRVFEVSGFIGAGAIESHLNSNVHKVLKGQVGAHLSFRTAGNTALFVEPFMALSTDGVDHSSNTNPSIYDVIYGVRAGCSLHFRSSGDFFKGTVYNGSLFFDFSQGAAMFYSRGGQPILKTMGTMYQVAMGKWLNPILGFRASVSVSDYYWLSLTTKGIKYPNGRVRPAYETRYKTYLFTGRIEGMLNPVHFSSRWRKTPHLVDLNLLLGGEFGWMSKRYSRGVTRADGYYKGITGAMQLLYNMTPTTSLYIEPRALLAMYSRSGKTINSSKSNVDKVGYVSAGVRLMYPTKALSATFEKHHFEPYLFAGAQLGGNRQIRASRMIGDGDPNILGALNVGYQYAPLAAAKFQLEYMLVNKNMIAVYEVKSGNRTSRSSALWRNKHGYMNMKLAYMLNLNNLYQKYDASRRLNFYLEGGPLLGIRVTQGAKIYSKETPIGKHPQPILKRNSDKASWGLFGGAILDYRILDRWSIYAEPEVQKFLDNNFPTIERHWANSIVLKFSFGATYRF